MALPPSIPTSFVPKQSVTPTRRATSGTNIFLLGSLVLLGFAVISAGGVFAYDRYLASVLNAKAAALQAAQSSVDQSTLQDLTRLHNRLSSGFTLLQNHVALSQFFDVLEGLTLTNVSFTSLKLSVADDRTAQVQMSGTAKSFNALAVESQTFAGEKRIKRAIFSGISTNKDGSVTFSLSADVDPSLIVMAAPTGAAAAPAAIATSTAATSTLPASIPPVGTPSASKSPVSAPSATTSPSGGTATTTAL